jgi:F-type H+-transporting ATPase subunit delta
MSNRSAGIRYARALFDVATAQKSDLDALERELADFSDLLTQHPALQQALMNPVVPVQRKRAAVEALTRTATPIVSKLLVLLAGRDRLVILPDLLAAFRDRVLDYKNVVRAEVTTAVPLAEGQAAAIERRLAEVSRRSVALSTRVDPSIVGGLVARVGGTVYDASVTTQLKKMRQRLIESV